MMYNQKLVCVVKVGGKVLREEGNTIKIPFGSEYTILLKNLNSVKCQVKISIDGKSISEDSDFIVSGGQSMEIERSIVSGNMDAGNRFKFIERTSKIEEFKGVGIEDGLIKIEYEFEKAQTIFNIGGSFPYYPPGVRGGLGSTYRDISFNNIGGQASSAPSQTLANTQWSGHDGAACTDYIPCASSVPKNDIGITVPGSVSSQKFQTVADIVSDGVKHVMVLRLVGQVNEVKVTKPVTVKHKPTCTTCGKNNKVNAKFCQECGTALTLFV